MLEHDFQSDIGYWLHMAAHRFECAMNAELSAAGLTYRQCQVLAWLALDGELSQIDLSHRMQVEPPTIARVLDRMERDELIIRSVSSSDRRRKMIRPTDKAIPLWKQIVECASRVQARSHRHLTPEQRLTLRHLLEQVYQDLGPEDDATPSQTDMAPQTSCTPVDA